MKFAIASVTARPQVAVLRLGLPRVQCSSLAQAEPAMAAEVYLIEKAVPETHARIPRLAAYAPSHADSPPTHKPNTNHEYLH